MFTLREAKKSDLEALYELSLFYDFINLPSDKDLLTKLINNSISSFDNPSSKYEKNYFLFVLEDSETSNIIGASMIHGKHGTKEKPHFYLKVSREHKYSETLNTGFIHGTLKFNLETDGWTEIGGLILSPKARKNVLKLGKALSFVRFIYIALNRELFTNQIHVELMPPFDKDGKSPLWEAIGRRFLNMDYHEADHLSHQNKEFILSLFPMDTIYGALLPIEARNSIGMVGKETLPVKSMLERIGFHYTEEVDPFDGGPHYRAETDEILPVVDCAKGKTLIFMEDITKINLNNVNNSHKMKEVSHLIHLKENGAKTFSALLVLAISDDKNLYLEACWKQKIERKIKRKLQKDDLFYCIKL